MKKHLFLLIALLHPFGAMAQIPAVLPTVDGSKEAMDETGRQSILRAKALELACGLAGEDFNIRDGFWFEKSLTASSKLLAVNLVAGNRYWFCIATAENGVPKLRIYDADGKLVKATERAESGLAAVDVTAPHSGRYFVEVGRSEERLPEFCLLYLFQ